MQGGQDGRIRRAELRGACVGPRPTRSRCRWRVSSALAVRGSQPSTSTFSGRLTAASSYPFFVGIDFADVAERVPAGEHGVQVGDRVFGMARTHGSYAEYTVVAPAAIDTLTWDAPVNWIPVTGLSTGVRG